MKKENINIKDFEKIKKVNAVILFGSVASGRANRLSDIDICIVGDLTQNDKSNIYSFYGEKYDISFFDELPIYIQMRVLHGKVLFCNDEDLLYRIYFSVFRKYQECKYFLNKRIEENFGKCMI